MRLKIETDILQLLTGFLFLKIYLKAQVCDHYSDHSHHFPAIVISPNKRIKHPKVHEAKSFTVL